MTWYVAFIWYKYNSGCTLVGTTLRIVLKQVKKPWMLLVEFVYIIDYRPTVGRSIRKCC